MVSHISHNPSETESIAEAIARRIGRGSVVGLAGDLGAGKTQFVRGFARGLGVTERVHSPTFALVNVYTSGRLPLFHLDLYRLETDAQITAAGLDEYFAPDGVAIIEWIDRWHGPSPGKFCRVELETLNETGRRITIHDHTGA